MDDVAVRTVIIAVNIFVTITIVSLVVIMFFQMGEIYGTVASTDTSIYNKFDDIHSIYHGKVESSIGLLNAIKKFEENKDANVILTYPRYDKVREEVKAYNEGRQDENKMRESTYLKFILEKDTERLQSLEVTNTLKSYYKYEDRYEVTVEEHSDGIIEDKYTKINY